MFSRLRFAALLLGALCACLPAAAPVHAQQRFRFEDTPGRLSKQVVPSRYALRLDLDPQRDGFDGRVEITLRVQAATPAIELHAFELAATQAQLATRAGTQALRVTPQPATQTWKLSRTDGAPIAPGEHRLVIDYAGKVNKSGEGLYVVPYAVDGQPRRLLSTQLEAIRARRLFPSFDEPAFRAVFDVTVRVPAGYDAYSNMPRVAPTARAARKGEKAEDAGKVEFRFAPTPRMPTYLVAVTVGKLEALEGRAGNVPVRILYVEGRKGQADFALATTKQLLPWFGEYFGALYALPKLDLLAVPGTRWGAMEDWGLISFNENLLLFDPARAGPFAQRQVFSIIAHEIGHQWFGNLVTAASWDEIWLNEAFATWVQAKAADRFHPQWQSPLAARPYLEEALAIDAGSATRAIRSGPVNENAVDDVFDAITYSKGGRVLTMLEQWIGPEAFRRGLAAYMKERKFSNATAADLWFHIGQAAGQDVRAVAASWTDQKGLPLVEVSTRCENGTLHVSFAQSRFSLGGNAAPGVWKIPLRWRRGAASGGLLLDQPTGAMTLPGCTDEPLVLNEGGIGFYRVAYADAARETLERDFGKLAEIDRVVLLSDTFAAVQAGRVPLRRYVTLLRALAQLPDATRDHAWRLVNEQLEFLDGAFAGQPAHARLQGFVQSLLAPLLDQVGWTPAAGEDMAVAELRADLIVSLARFGHAPTLAEATRVFDAADAGTAPLPASMREAVTRAAGFAADRAHFDRLVQRLKTADNERDRRVYSRAVAAVRDPALIDEVLQLSLSDFAPPNVTLSLLRYVAETPQAGARVYAFVLDNWKVLSARAGVGGRRYLIPQGLGMSNDTTLAAQMVDDQGRRVGVQGEALAARVAEGVRLRAAVREREAEWGE